MVESKLLRGEERGEREEKREEKREEVSAVFFSFLFDREFD